MSHSTAEMGRRERKKEATRLALHRAAVRLAGEVGLDQVTVEAIADAADVSRRTFSNYFANKEEAILWRDLRGLSRLIELVAAQPPERPAWAALCAACEQLLVERDADPHWASELRLLRRHPSLIGRQQAMYTHSELTLADMISQRLPATPDRDTRARLMAATLLTTIRITIQLASAQPDRPLLETLRHLLAIAAEPWP